jgi:hypothetical protein
MPPFDVSARITVEDAFSGPLDKLIAKSKEANLSLGQVGTGGGMPGGSLFMNQMQNLQLQSKDIASEFSALGQGGAGGGLGGVAAGAGQASLAMGGLMGTVGKLIPGLMALGTIVGIKNLISDLTELGLTAEQISARFTAFSGGAIQAATNMAAMDTAVGNAMSRMDKMAMISRIMSLDLADSAEQAAEVAKMALILGAAGASASDRISNFTRMLSTGVVRGLAAYGINVQEVKKRSNELMIINADMTKQEATSAAMLEFAAAKMAQVEAAGGKAATTTREFGSAWEDLKLAVAEKISPIIEPVIVKAKEIVEGGSKSIEAAGRIGAIDRAVEARKKLEAADEELAAAEAKFNEEQASRPYGATVNVQSWLKTATETRDAALAAYAIAKASLGVGTDFANLAMNITEANFALSKSDVALAYQAAINDLVSKSSGVLALGASLGTLSQSLKDLGAGVQAMPKIGDNILAIDTGGLMEYIATVRSLNPLMQETSDKALAQVGSFDAQQRAILATATAMQDHNAALELLAEKTLGAGASISDLISKFDTLPGPVRTAINEIGGFTAALEAMQDKARQPISLGIRVTGMSQALSEVDTLALGVAGIVDPAQLTQFRDQMRSDLESYYASVGNIDKFELDAGKARHLDYWKDIIKNTQDYQKKDEQAAKDHNAEMQKLETSTRSNIQSVMSEGLKVTPAQMLATAQGTYADQALESVRRLQAIAERGRAELKKHPDWAGFLQIPPNILSGSDLALQTWAAQMKEDVSDLSQPGLINWDAFIEGYRKKLDKETAKGITMDMALTKIKDAGLLSGSDEERRKRVAQMLGISEPSVTFDTYFKPDEKAYGTLISDVLGGRKAAEIPAEIKLTNPEVLDRLEKLNNGSFIPIPPANATAPPSGAAYKFATMPEPELTPAEKAEYNRKKRQLLESGSEIPQPPPMPNPYVGFIPQPPPPSALGFFNTPYGPPTPPTPLPSLPKPGQLGYADIDITKMGDQSAPFMNQGKKWLEWTAKGWDQGMPDLNLGSSFIQGLDSASVESRDQFEGAGKNLGHMVGGAFNKAVLEDVKDTRHDLAWLIAPAVAEILKSSNKGREMP